MFGFVLRRLALFLALITLIASTIQATPPPPDYWPTDGWRSSPPEAQGMDSGQLADMLEHIQQEGYRVHSIQIIRNGYLVLDSYIYPFNSEALHLIHSATKSFTSALVGIAMGEGFIESVDQTVLSFLPDQTIDNIDARKEAMTVEDLLTMTSGLYCRDSALYGWTGLREMQASADWVGHSLSLPMEHEPGSHFEYCNGVSHTLSAIVQQTTGMTTLEFARQYLFDPLGINDLVWLTDPQGIAIGNSNLLLHPLDMAKFGYLFLHGGQWDGQQIVPAEWVAESTQAHVFTNFPAKPTANYGYQWWVDKQGRFYDAAGYGGQEIFVLPDLNMVVVLTSGGYYTPEDFLEDFIIPAVRSDDPLPDNAPANARLTALVESLAQPPDPTSSARFPDTEQTISGQTFTLTTDELLGWQSFSPRFEDNNAFITMTFVGDIALDLAIGLDNRFIFTSVDVTSLGIMPVPGPIGLRGFWEDDNTFVINLHSLGGSEDVWIDLSFFDTGVYIGLQERTSHITRQYRGTLEDSD